MSKSEEITYSEILKINKGNRWRTDRVVEYYSKKENLTTFLGKYSSEPHYFLNGIQKKDLKYRSTDFEPPISRREWVAWALTALSIIASVLIAIFK